MRLPFLGFKLKLSHLLQSKEITIAPGVYDLLTAKIAERAGFQMMIATLAPNADWSTPSNIAVQWRQVFLDQVKLICESVNVPVILDARPLYDTPRALEESATQLELCGLAGIIVGEETDEQSLRALIAARHDTGFATIASAQFGTDTIQRVKTYRSAGADVVLLRGARSMDELQTAPQEIVDLPLMIEMRDDGHLPLLSAYQLQNLGYSIAYWQNLATSASTQAVWEALRELKTLGKGRRPCSNETNCS